jgi:hypothetical protein
VTEGSHLQVDDRHGGLRGVEMQGQLEIVDDVAAVARYASALSQRSGSKANSELTVEQKAHNRSVIRFVPARIALWDHAKLPNGAHG